VINGIGVMPPFEGTLSSEEIEAVAYFISASAGH
ncbi:MAG: cytochrome c, partial [Pelagibacteraceae bacterium]|nr:cytochrome c [Pelagibacteraceae bacterium]